MTGRRAVLQKERIANPFEQEEVAAFLNMYDTPEARRALAWHFWWGDWSMRIRVAWKVFQDQKTDRGNPRLGPDWYATGAAYLRLLAEGADGMRAGRPTDPVGNPPDYAEPPERPGRLNKRVDRALARSLVYYLRKTEGGEWRPPVNGLRVDPQDDNARAVARGAIETLEARDFDPWFQSEAEAVVSMRWGIARSFVKETLRSPTPPAEAEALANLARIDESARDHFLGLMAAQKEHPFAPFMGYAGNQFFGEIHELLEILAMTTPGASLFHRFRHLGLSPSGKPRPV